MKKGQATRKIVQTTAVFLLLLFIAISPVGNLARAIIYNPGETLDPACSPTDPNCTVATTSLSLATTNFTSTNVTSTNLAATNFSLGALSGLLKAVSGAVSAALINLASDVTGVLGIANGGTGWSNLASGTVLLGNGGGALATTTRGNLIETGSAILTITGGSNAVLGGGATIQVAQAGSSASGFISAVDWALFNNKISSSSLSAGAGIAYDSLTGVFTNTGVTALAGTANQITASAATGALTLSLPAFVSLTTASSSQLSVFNKAYFGATATSSFSSAGALTLAAALTVDSGGTGASSFGQGWLSSSGSGNALTASTSPTVNYITATSTANTSTFAGGINVTGGCLAQNGVCIRGSDSQRAHTDSGNDTNTALSTAATSTLLTLTITPATAQGDVYINAQTLLVSGSNTDGSAILAIRKTNCTGTVIGETKVLVTVANGTLVGTIQLSGTDVDPGAAVQTYAFCASAVTQSHNVRLSSLDLLVIDTGADVAELYATNDPSLQAGDVVMPDEALAVGVKKSDHAYGRSVIGVIATKPALLVGSVSKEGVNALPVALAGRVPVRVSAANGPILAGDFLTSSDIPGVAMKATKPGPIIGQALTGYAGEDVGSALVFVKNSHFTGNQIEANEWLENLGIASATATEDYISASTTGLLGDVLANKMAGALQYLTDKINQGFKIVKEIFVQKITALVGVFERVKTNDLEIKDAATGDAYCLRIVHGDWQKQPGTCDIPLSLPAPGTEGALWPQIVESPITETEAVVVTTSAETDALAPPPVEIGPVGPAPAGALPLVEPIQLDAPNNVPRDQ